MKRTWLLFFNAITLLAWTAFLAITLMNGMAFTEEGLWLLNVAQGLAIFEILNSILGIAGSNWLLTSLQVGSRLLVLVLLNLIPESMLQELAPFSGFAIIALAWSITEIVRALFYLSELVGQSFQTIVFLRYSLFLILYPLGVTGEFIVMYRFVQSRGMELDVITIALAAVALSYLVFFPKLFGHMLKQRKKKL